MKDIMSNLIVVKRSGQRVSFNGTKIAVAIKNAFDSVPSKYGEEQINLVYESVLKFLKNNYSDRKTINVEDIQDIIEKELINNKFNDVYEAFNCYRNRRAASREVFSVKQQHKFVKAIEMLTLDEKKHGDYNFITSDFGNIFLTEYAKSYILENKYLRSHEEANIYINGLNLFPSGVVTSSHLDFSKLECDELYIDNIIYMMISTYSETKSECSIGSIDILLSRFLIYRFKGVFKEILSEYLTLNGFIDYISFNQVERVIDELNSINVDMATFGRYALNKKIENIFDDAYNNSIKKLKTYMYHELYRLFISVNNSLFNGKYSLSLSVNKSYESIFIRNIILDIINNNQAFKNIYLFVRVSDDTEYNKQIVNAVKDNKNIIIINKNIKDLEYFSNGERIYENIISEESGSVGRSIISTTTINLVRIALKNKNISAFYSELSNVLDFVKNQMMQRFEYQASKGCDKFRYLFKNNMLLDSEKLEEGQKIRKVIKNGVLNINICGLVEAIKVLDENNDNFYKLCLNILTYINKKVKVFTEENKLNFIVSCESNEVIGSKLLSLDKAIYGLIKGINDYKSYKLVSDMFLDIDVENPDELLFIGKCQKLINFIPNISVKGKVSEKKIMNIIDKIKDSNIDVYRIIGGIT